MEKKILIVEDDAACAMILSRVIQSLEPTATVEWEESAERAFIAIDKIKATGHEYNLIIADIFLSGKSTGLELWQTYQNSYSNVPILITSSLPTNRFFDSIGPQSIAPPFLAKPFHLGECKQMIKGLLSYN